jgi:hypothetical protein
VAMPLDKLDLWLQGPGRCVAKNPDEEMGMPKKGGKVKARGRRRDRTRPERKGSNAIGCLISALSRANDLFYRANELFFIAGETGQR